MLHVLRKGYRVDADKMARRIIAAAPNAASGPMGLLEELFDRKGDAAIAAAIAHWGVVEYYGTVSVEEMRAVETSLLRLLK